VLYENIPNTVAIIDKTISHVAMVSHIGGFFIELPETTLMSLMRTKKIKSDNPKPVTAPATISLVDTGSSGGTNDCGYMIEPKIVTIA
jgi:hypothetical protein